ncbi:MAG: GNAT family N-acetyltransferase [Candidatus Methanofastidiosa archaeon]|nr:GNAT family N-acetyltransferase [Candidatus Methanofastidiosa archaeon]NMA31976.1 GNAT family N-acetyltransferase [Candidatus Methanofastidiosa archaeon]
MSKEQVIKDKETWNEIIEGFTSKDVYFIYNYFVPFQNNGDGEPILYYFECEHGKVAYPFMLRDIAESENFRSELEKNRYFDISSAYGYGGPLYEGCEEDGSMPELKKAFFKSFSNYCNKKNIISQFDRFHPLINNHTFFEEYSGVLPIRKTVYMDLNDKEKMWSNLDSKCRNKIRKAKKNEVSIVLEDELKTIEGFKNIYNSTMDRRDASEYYYFNDNFFNDTIDSLGKNVFIANAYYEDKIIASSLIMRHSRYLHYHFSGALREYRKLQANNLLLYEVAKWGNENGYEKFHLGGGYESESDSLYKFKKSFSRLEDNDFYIGKRIYDVEMYDRLTDIVNKRKPGDGLFFPAYRE